MKLIITLINNNKKIDFQLNDEMVIKDALGIISDNTEFKIDKMSEYIYSKRKGEQVSINYTFKQAEIFSGDELIMEDIKNG